MKTVRCLAALLFGAGLFPLPADDDNPAANNPDATPRAYAETPRRSSANSTATAPRPASTANNDWLVRAYEEQLQARSLADGGNQNNNLYSEITSSEELARAAGLSPAQTVKPADAASLHTGSTGGTPSLTLRHDATAAPASPRGDGDLAHSTGLQFKPFITPLDSSALAGMHDFFSNLPALSSTAPSAQPDTGALDTPGMTAAESDPTRKQELGLIMDPLPGETAAQPGPHRDLSLTLPDSRNAERLQKQQDAALLLPGQHKTAPPVPINPLLLQPPPSPTADMVPDHTPVRGAGLGDPYDILR